MEPLWGWQLFWAVALTGLSCSQALPVQSSHTLSGVAAFLPPLPDKRCRHRLSESSTRCQELGPPISSAWPKASSLAFSPHPHAQDFFFTSLKLRQVSGNLCLPQTGILRLAAQLGRRNRVGYSSGMVQKGAWLSYSWALEEGREFFTGSWKLAFPRQSVALAGSGRGGEAIPIKEFCSNTNYPDDKSPGLWQSSW